MEKLRQAIATHNDGEADHQLDIILVDRRHCLEPEPTDRQPEQGPASSLNEERFGCMTNRERLGAERCGEQDREYDNADAIVEEAFARDRRLKRRRHRGPLQHAHHGNRIGRADQRAEHEAPERRDAQPQGGGQQEKAATYNQGG